MVESVVVISDQSPVGKNSAVEAIRIGSGFTALGEFIDCKIVFTGDAVYLFNKNCDPEAVGMDPLEFRLKNLKDKRMIRVLKAVAKEFGWIQAKVPSGRGFGIATGIDAGTYVAHMQRWRWTKRQDR